MSPCAAIFVVLSAQDRKMTSLGRSKIPTLRVYFTLCYLMLTRPYIVGWRFDRIESLATGMVTFPYMLTILVYTLVTFT